MKFRIQLFQGDNFRGYMKDASGKFIEFADQEQAQRFIEDNQKEGFIMKLVQVN